jgi:hypothetical protein
MPAALMFQVMIGLDQTTHDALAWRKANILPIKSTSAFCREAIFEKLAREFPQAFHKSEKQLAAE